MNFRARACLISTVWAMTKNVNKPFFHLHINAIVILLLWCLKKQRIAYGCDHKQNLSQSSWKPITFMWNGIFWCFQQRCPEFESPPLTMYQNKNKIMKMHHYYLWKRLFSRRWPIATLGWCFIYLYLLWSCMTVPQ